MGNVEENDFSHNYNDYPRPVHPFYRSFLHSFDSLIRSPVLCQALSPLSSYFTGVMRRFSPLHFSPC